MQPVVDTLKSWQLHPFVDHFTVALILIGVATDLVGSLIWRRLWIRYMALSLMILGTAGAWGSNVTGGWDAGRVWDNVTGPGKAILQRHAELGDYLPWAFLALALWRIGTQFIGFIAVSRPIYLAIAVLAAGAIIYQGRLGGQLVYDYGVGTAMMPGGNGTSISTTPAPRETPAETVPPAATPIPTVFVPSAAATPAAPTAGASAEASPVISPSPPAISPSVAPSPATPMPGTAEAPPLESPSPAASPAESGPKNL